MRGPAPAFPSAEKLGSPSGVEDSRAPCLIQRVLDQRGGNQLRRAVFEALQLRFEGLREAVERLDDIAVVSPLWNVLARSCRQHMARGRIIRGFGGRVRWADQIEETYRILERFDVELDIHRPLAEATPVQRTVVAIAGALRNWQGGGGVLVLDEPTAVLPHDEVERLLAMVREVRRSGTSVLYVSHRLDEIFEIADRVTVLRAPGITSRVHIEYARRLQPEPDFARHYAEGCRPGSDRRFRGPQLDPRFRGQHSWKSKGAVRESDEGRRCPQL